MMTDEKLVGIVGLGGIGAAAAKHILASGRPMVGWARRSESLDGFAAYGGRVVRSLAKLGFGPIKGIPESAIRDPEAESVILG